MSHNVWYLSVPTTCGIGIVPLVVLCIYRRIFFQNILIFIKYEFLVGHECFLRAHNLMPSDVQKVN